MPDERTFHFSDTLLSHTSPPTGPHLSQFCLTPTRPQNAHVHAGEGISPHVDTHSAFEDGIASLSLGADAVMEFSRMGAAPFLLPLPRVLYGCLCVCNHLLVHA